ncbi:MAG: pentapeptide repeat-containing protein [Deltaproteobacteria bacterium]|nr:pentapeptide repeat-containing protein [Deltaproteobacteria bacterium]
MDKAYAELLQISPGDATTLVERGNFRYRMRRYEDALSDYLAAITVDGQNKEARRGRAICLVLLGRSNELGASDRDFTAIEYSDGGTQRISFAGLDLRRASFRDVKFNFLNFTGADLRGADFSGATLTLCNFAAAKLTGAKFENLKSADQTTFEKAELEHANFRGACLRDGVKFGGSVLDNADFSKADLYRASFKNASLRSVNFKKVSHLNTADFVGADLSEADLSGQKLTQYDMCDARFVRVKLYNANLSKAVFSRKPNSPEYSDDDNHIISSVISFADAGRGKQFCGVNFTGANLEGADFSYTILDKAVFADAEYNEKTTWPKGFDPAKIGARKVR